MFTGPHVFPIQVACYVMSLMACVWWFALSKQHPRWGLRRRLLGYLAFGCGSMLPQVAALLILLSQARKESATQNVILLGIIILTAVGLFAAARYLVFRSNQRATGSESNLPAKGELIDDAGRTASTVQQIATVLEPVRDSQSKGQRKYAGGYLITGLLGCLLWWFAATHLQHEKSRIEKVPDVSKRGGQPAQVMTVGTPPRAKPMTLMEKVRAAAEAGDAKSQAYLAQLYFLGDGVAKDYVEAASWDYKAAVQGCVEAQYNLAVSYLNGLGVTQNEALALKWYRKAGEQGDVNAQIRLGCFYYQGEHVSQDYAEAAKWFQKAAAQGCPEGQLYYGLA